MERWTGVRRKGEARAISAALIAAGVRIVEAASGTDAPLVYRVVMPRGEELTLICYAFSANKYRQRNRPAGEHRFQIKYGDLGPTYHKLHVPAAKSEVTLLFGWHEERGTFVGADPEMHNPTRFSSSVEFKTHNLDEVGIRRVRVILQLT